MCRLMGTVTRVAQSTKNSKSVKATIPEAIVEFLELSRKDGIEWLMKTSDDERYAIVRKARI
jgi:hypothetical protein